VNARREGFDYESFSNGVYENIIKANRAPAFIESVCEAIKKLAVDYLHIVGDIFDRGEHPDLIMDMLLPREDVDIQWGNHDILWIGAGLGNTACIANVLYIALKAGDVAAIEDGYGISLRRLEEYARKTYEYDEKFAPRNKNLTERENKNYARMRKAIFFMMQKAEAKIIESNPDYGMDDRVLLKRINKADGLLTMPDGKKFYDEDFKKNYVDIELTDAEIEVLEHFKKTFTSSEKLQKHIAFLINKGGIYKVVNGNLLYHGCVPLNADGSYAGQKLKCGVFSGKAYFDACEKIVRRAYASHFAARRDDYDVDFIWYLWCGRLSPLFGRDKIATFERVYLPKEYWEEVKNPCYEYEQKKEICEKILEDFGVEGGNTHIINGHVPVKTKDGENPIKAGGKLIVIDGGFCRAYQPTTGIAGYTLIYNSYGLRLSAHEPFGTKEEAIENCLDIHSNVTVFEHTAHRLTVADTDQGKEIRARIADLQKLLDSGLL
jgi:fructose-1,6-bisphosphatase-3